MSQSPCIAACKNNGGLCSGCQRTMEEIVQWRHYNHQEKRTIMDKLNGIKSTHHCPECGKPTWCGVQDNQSTCWCFDIEKRVVLSDNKSCLCRSCLNQLPIKE